MMLAALRNRAYARLFAAQVLALVGTGLLTVALGLLAVDVAGNEAGIVINTALKIAKRMQIYEARNATLLEYLDSYINELTSKNQNDKEIASIQNELERMLVVLKNINKK